MISQHKNSEPIFKVKLVDDGGIDGVFIGRRVVQRVIKGAPGWRWLNLPTPVTNSQGSAGQYADDDDY